MTGDEPVRRFTNNTKPIADYVIINNEDYKTSYLGDIWVNLKDSLLANRRGYVAVPNALKDMTTGARTVEGLQILNQRNAGDYYEDSSIILSAANAALADLATSVGDAYKN